MRREFLTLPNVLSLARLFLVVPLLLVLLSPLPHARLWAAAIILLGGATDYYDGYFARKLKCETDWGRILDPVADKVGAAGVAVALLLLGELPFWFLGLLVARDALILAGGLFIRSRSGVVLPSIYIGKVTVTVVVGSLFLLILGVGGVVRDFLLIASTAFLLISFVMYVRRFMEVLRTGK